MPPDTLMFIAVADSEDLWTAGGKNSFYMLSKRTGVRSDEWEVTIKRLEKSYVSPMRDEVIPVSFQSEAEARTFCALHDSF